MRYAGFAKVHTFPFSAIRGTAAWTYKEEAPPPAVVKRRCAELAQLERDLAQQFRRPFIGQEIEALVELPHDESDAPRAPRGQMQAMTHRHASVFFPRPADAMQLVGKVARFHMTGLAPHGLAGEMVR